MTDQNLENEGIQGQNPQSEQTQQPPAIPQEQGSQPQSRPQYQEQAQTNPQAQGQPQYQSQTQYQGQPNYKQPNYGSLPSEDKPNNYMVMNIIATVVGFLCGACCVQGIIGIIGIVFSSQVDSKYAQGDLNGAISSANTARILGIVSLVLTGLALIGVIIYFAFIFAAVGTGSFMESYMDALEQLQ